MKRSSTAFLKIVILLFGVGVFASLVWFPQTEGRAANLDIVHIYSDPFILYIYLASTPFFWALSQIITLLGYVEKNKIFSHAAVKTVKNLKFCALAIIGFLGGAVFYIRLMAQGDDSAGPTMLSFVAIFTSIVIAATTAVFERLLQNAVDIKSENDLTV